MRTKFSFGVRIDRHRFNSFFIYYIDSSNYTSSFNHINRRSLSLPPSPPLFLFAAVSVDSVRSHTRHSEVVDEKCLVVQDYGMASSVIY